MKIPEFEFRMSDAANSFAPKKFVDALAATGCWWRDERSLIQFKRGTKDYVRIERRSELAEILRDGTTLRITGDNFDQNVIDCLWQWLLSRKWSLPRLNPEKPWIDPRPKFENRGRDCAS